MALTDNIMSKMQTMLQNEASRFDFIAYIMMISAASSVIALQFTSAPYGRYSRSNWGFLIPSRIAWFVQELPSFSVPILLILFTDCPLSGQWKNQVAVGLYLLHYFQRTFVFPLLIQGGKPTPVVTFVMALLFCVVNGYLQGGHLLKYADLTTVPNVQFYAGIMTFLSGMLINIHSDHILRNLRKEGEKGYKIPRGGMFQYVSGANFFGECLEWTGFAVMCGTLPALAFAVFTVCNIGPRACQHHRWYQEKFEDYPKDRKALIPFVF
ncbi:3-oxo-5-alpha-steroid 4-dehydrogenase 1-like [Babylonia areolata]|uniref:3-oxo-5-alpha-steroid 4-dehydrogenase 1-like n=1 Tax=Babylonia areolata TaxID=304850 RepID=UPI003FD2DE2E